MLEILTLDNLFTLLMLLLLQLVLGFDNLLYISIESKRAPADKQAWVRRNGILMAIGLRIVLLVVIMYAIDLFQDVLFTIPFKGYFEGQVTGHSLIVFFGGAFIIYTAIKEISHMLAVHDLEHDDGKGTKSVASIIAWIVVMNLIFSFDSILSALALTKVFAVLATAIVISGLMMLLLADHVSAFLQKNRMYEVLGLFILFIVGIMLLSEGGHLAHIKLFDQPVEQMSKSTFYFVLMTLIVVDVVQSQYQKKLMRMKAREINDPKVIVPVNGDEG